MLPTPPSPQATTAPTAPATEPSLPTDLPHNQHDPAAVFPCPEEPTIQLTKNGKRRGSASAQHTRPSADLNGPLIDRTTAPLEAPPGPQTTPPTSTPTTSSETTSIRVSVTPRPSLTPSPRRSTTARQPCSNTATMTDLISARTSSQRTTAKSKMTTTHHSRQRLWSLPTNSSEVPLSPGKSLPVFTCSNGASVGSGRTTNRRQQGPTHFTTKDSYPPHPRPFRTSTA